jgi:hypothetical protein
MSLEFKDLVFFSCANTVMTDLPYMICLDRFGSRARKPLHDLPGQVRIPRSNTVVTDLPYMICLGRLGSHAATPPCPDHLPYVICLDRL